MPTSGFLDGQHVLITGGTGSFGHAFVRRVLQTSRPERLIIFSRDEMKQYEMGQSLSEEEFPCLRYFIGDVRDERRLEMAMRDIDVVIHAAALKHVPIAEYNPFECVKTNVHGAENIVNVAIQTGVSKIIGLSTDKAVNPINLYGATKLASDKIFIAGNNLSGKTQTRFSVVRYGNVLGSRGSVVPFYRKLIADGARSLPLTNEGMTRFWITLDQGVDFVLDSLERMVGGEVFIPKLPSMRMTDLVEAMLPGAEIEMIGIRPGEKLHEVMIPADEARSTLVHDDYYVIEPNFEFWHRPRRPGGGVPVPEFFEYNSRDNDTWLDVEQLRALIREIDEPKR